VRAGRWAMLAVVGMLSAITALVATAPATIADALLARASLGRVRLAQAEGSLWNGSGRLVLVGAPGSGGQADPSQGLVVPVTLRWQVRALPLLLGLVDANIALEGAGEAVRISGQPSDLRIAAGGLRFPELQLAGLGSPWNTIRPSAALALRWQSLAIREGILDGTLDLQMRDVASAVSSVRPLGSYRVEVRGDGRNVGLVLTTQEGALRLQGQGGWDRRQGLRFEAEARAAGEHRASLESLLTLMGRREGDRTMIRIGG
jgi:general secretion pathway protein N